ncbi:MAG TPA: EamA family transporter [Candidatus Nanoarchaeia archaeon]|nr:EamA family transporter [Candidatus Nanoarchaeia archaeon]
MKNKPKRTATFAIFITLFCTLLTSLGQLLLKWGSSKLELSFWALVTNYYLIGGCIVYGVGAILLIVALKYGELSTLYPLIALSFVWVGLLSIYLLHEEVTLLNWMGIVSILGGVSSIGWGANHD